MKKPWKSAVWEKERFQRQADGSPSFLAEHTAEHTERHRTPFSGGVSSPFLCLLLHLQWKFKMEKEKRGRKSERKSDRELSEKKRLPQPVFEKTKERVQGQKKGRERVRPLRAVGKLICAACRLPAPAQSEGAAFCMNAPKPCGGLVCFPPLFERMDVAVVRRKILALLQEAIGRFVQFALHGDVEPVRLIVVAECVGQRRQQQPLARPADV